MTLPDVGAFALAIFSDRIRWSGQTLNVVSQFVTGQEIADTVQRVAGVKAIYKPVTIKEWLADLSYADKPVASMDPEGITVGENFSLWWPGFEDSILLKYGMRDMELLKSVHPGLQSLEDWIRSTGYDGTAKPLFKNVY
jgi:hypothetical protein